MCYCHLFYSIQVVLWTLWVVVGYSLVFSGFTSAFLCWSLGGTLAVIISYSIQFIVNSRDRDLQNGVLTLFLLPLSVFSAWATPHWFESLYLSLIRATEPLLLLLQSVFVVRLIVLSSNYLIGFIEEKPTLIKSVILGVSAVSYMLALMWTADVYRGAMQLPNDYAVPLSTLVSLCVTFLVLLSYITVQWDGGIISNSALVSVYVMSIVRTAWYESAALLSSSAQHRTLPFLWYWVRTHISGPLASPDNRFSSSSLSLSDFVVRTLSLDFLLSLLTLVALPFTLQCNTERERATAIPRRRALIFRGLAVLLALWIYSHHVFYLGVDSVLLNNALLWRTVQSFFTLLLYFLALYTTRRSFSVH